MATDYRTPGKEMEFFLTVLGVILILEGVPWFLTPGGTKDILRQVGDISDSKLRWGGFAAMGIGLLLVYWGVN